MKLKVYTDKNIKNLRPIDIRKIIGSITDDKYIDLVLWHKHTPPEVLYSKPLNNSFEIINYTNNLELLTHIKEKLQNIELFKQAKVIKTEILPEDYIIPQKGLYVYETRTPIILSINPVEYKIIYAINQNNNLEDLRKYLTSKFIKDINHKLKHYFNTSIKIDDLNLILQDKRIRLVEVKDDEKKRQAIFLKFASNYKLPRFVSYSNGLGWGELIEKQIFVDDF